MTAFDVFNGDADGVLALHQWRLAYPLETTLVTGIKRDIGLLSRVPSGAAACVTVFDISLDANRDALCRLLADGVQIVYVDHHYAGAIPQHAGLTAHIDTSSEICTSLLVDGLLDGRFRLWAIAAACGDNLTAIAHRLAQESGLNGAQAALLEQLGHCINYNGYGDTLTDLHVHPAELYTALHAYTDPFAFIAQSSIFGRLAQGMAADHEIVSALLPWRASDDAALYLLPDTAWARRIGGIFANELAHAHPHRAHAVLTPNTQGNYTVSVRAPLRFPHGADILCRRFPDGGGRARAAGINQLAIASVDDFQQQLFAHFDRRSRPVD